MLYLFTGVPGSGKTLNVVSMLAKRPDLKNRPLFIDGIPDLQIPHEPIPEGESIQLGRSGRRQAQSSWLTNASAFLGRARVAQKYPNTFQN